MAKRIYKVKAILFDMDGVITNTMPDHYQAWETILKKESVFVTHLDIYSREGQRGIQSVRELFNKYKKKYSLSTAKRILKNKEEYFKTIARNRFIPGTRMFLKKLYQQEFKLGLVTGTSRHELHRILPKHIYDLFTVIITGSDVKNGKPHPEPFLKCLKQFKLKASEAIVLENAPFGIEAAKEAGLRCLALETSLPKKYLSQADQVFRSINDLKSKITFKRIL